MFLKKVECSGIINRRWIPEEKRTKQDPGNKKWVWSLSIFRGYIIGERTLSNGHNEWMGEGEGSIYTPNRYFKAYLVVYDIHKKPVFVLPEDVKIIKN